MERTEIIVRLSPELVRLIRIEAAKAEISRNEWINRILQQAIPQRKEESRNVPHLVRY